MCSARLDCRDCLHYQALALKTPSRVNERYRDITPVEH